MVYLVGFRVLCDSRHWSIYSFSQTGAGLIRIAHIGCGRGDDPVQSSCVNYAIPGAGFSSISLDIFLSGSALDASPMVRVDMCRLLRLLVNPKPPYSKLIRPIPLLVLHHAPDVEPHRSVAPQIASRFNFREPIDSAVRYAVH